MTQAELRKLTGQRYPEGVAISLYIPTVIKGRQVEQNHIRFKNMLREAEDKLAQAGIDKKQVDEITSQLWPFSTDHEFWEEQFQSIAFFAAPGFMEYHKLPLEVTELINVNHRFYIKPLLDLFHQEDFFVLALSQNSLRLLKCSKFNCEELELSQEAPKSLEESARFKDRSNEIQHHTMGPSGGGTSNSSDEGQASREEDLRDFLRKVAASLSDRYKIDDKHVVLAAAPAIAATFKENSSYKNILPEIIEGNPENVSNQELQQRAWELMEPLFHQKIQEIKVQFGNQIGKGTASTDLSDVLLAAQQGRVRWALVDKNQNLWGTYDPKTNTLATSPENTPGSEDLLDLAALEVINNGGDVYLVEEPDMPNSAQIAAVYRY